MACGLSSHGLWALERRLSSCGAWAQLLAGMWHLPGPGLEPMSPALAGGFLTTVPPGKSCFRVFFKNIHFIQLTHIIQFTLLQCTIQWFLVCSQNFATIVINFRTFSSPQKETSHPSAVTFPSPHAPQSSATTNLLSAYKRIAYSGYFI